jgi:peptidyl-tRNA hydrolase, PTH1 family
VPEVRVENLYLMVGLGNPGTEYAQTRHNAGFMALDRFAARRKVTWKRAERFQARVARAEFEGQRLVLIKPQTFMNLSGTAVQSATAFYKVPTGQLLVLVDDADLPFGEIRMRAGGSSGGHHGLESIEQRLGTRAYARVRVGIGRGSDGVREITDYVLGRFGQSDMPLLEAVLDRACNQIECWLRSGVTKAMNEFNGMINTPLGEGKLTQ